ncbi:phospholipase D-like domain-containing protein [Saccharicrinis aurantiacus]|uniref:phospholipase D-like domain-containing protein n=1 Tax=Saccharicrinis aurantiacus TaxID=1849719 RepID=UPI00094FF842|nr:phospholipase D-like domain-containing protein [Saccharicrinis aurantiacus]
MRIKSSCGITILMGISFIFCFMALSCSDQLGDNQSGCICPDDENEEGKEATPKYANKIIFNNPQTIFNGKSDRIIFDQFIYLLDAAPKASDVYVSIYMFDDHYLARALNKTKARGVNVHLQVDQSRSSSINSNKEVIEILKEEFDDFIVINNASATSINHNKFAIFSSIEEGGVVYENIIFQTSSNFMDESTYKFQDAQVFQSQELAKAYTIFFNSIGGFNNAGSMLNFEYLIQKDSLLDLRVQFYPKRSNGIEYGGDCFEEIMDEIDLNEEGHLLINMSAWTDTRSSIFTKLSEVAQSRVGLTVITKNSNHNSVLSALDALRKDGAEVIILDQYGSPKQNTHMKVMTFTGTINHMPATFVVTGTHNLTTNALRYNNETLLYFNHEGVFKRYDDFHKQFLTIYQNL